MTRDGESTFKDRMRYEDGDWEMTICIYCAHKTPGKLTCKAFPTGIPAFIWNMKSDHLEPIKGDNGFQFTLREGYDLPKRLRKP